MRRSTFLKDFTWLLDQILRANKIDDTYYWRPSSDRTTFRSRPHGASIRTALSKLGIVGRISLRDAPKGLVWKGDYASLYIIRQMELIREWRKSPPASSVTKWQQFVRENQKEEASTLPEDILAAVDRIKRFRNDHPELGFILKRALSK